jgi:hypothetical protein
MNGVSFCTVTVCSGPPSLKLDVINKLHDLLTSCLGFVFENDLLGLNTNPLKINQPGYFRVNPFASSLTVPLVHHTGPRAALVVLENKNLPLRVTIESVEKTLTDPKAIPDIV